MMMIGLTNYIRSTIDLFRSGIVSLNPVYESENFLYSNLDNLNNINLLGDTTLVITPNSYNEGILYTVKGNSLTTIYNMLENTENTLISSVVTNSTGVFSSTASSNPFGAASSFRMQANATNGSHNFVTPFVSNIAGNQYSYSVYMKKGIGVTAPDIMQMWNTNSTPVAIVNYNISSGLVTSATNSTAIIATAGNGWWRCSLTFTASVTTATPRLGIAFCNNNPTASQSPVYVDATTSDVFLWGFQVEQSATASTYQPVPYVFNLAKGYLNYVRTTAAYKTDIDGSINESPQINIIPFSQALNSWSNVNMSVGTDVIIAPDGTLTADSSTATGTSRRHQIGASGYYSLAPIDNYVFSTYVKQGAGTATTLTLTNNSSNTTPAAAFNITNGTISSTVGCSASISDEGNGWYRCAIYVTSLAIGTVIIHHNGTTSTLGCYFWGMQVTRGTTLQPYYPTITRVNTPRIDYEEGEPVLLMEQTNSNGILRSEEFDNASWIKSNLLISANSVSAPNGLMTADTITATANSGYITQNSGVFSSNLAGVASVWLKRKTGSGDVTVEVGRTIATASISTNSWTRVYVQDTALSATYSISGGTHSITTSVDHNLNTGDQVRFGVLTGVGTTTNGMLATVTGPNTFTYFVGTASGSGTANLYARFMRIKLVTSGDEVYAWGAQYEITSSVLQNGYYQPTSYIPTTTATSTRTFDTMSVDKSNLLSNNYSIFYEVKKIGGGSSQDYHIALTDAPGGFTSNSILINGLPLGARKMDGGVNTTLTVGGYTPVNNTYYKGLITCNNGVFDIWLDGVKIVSTTMVNHLLARYLSIQAIANGVAKFKRVYGWNRVLNRTEIDSLFQFTYYNSGYSPVNYELQQVINRAYYEGFTLPSTTTLGYCDSLITSMKNDGSWLITDMFFNFTYNNTTLANFSRINWKNPNSKLNGICVLNGTTNYRVDGFKGNGTDFYIDSLFNPSLTANIPYSYTQSNAGRMIVVSEDATPVFGVYEGNTGTSTRMMPFLSNLGAFTANTFNSAAATIDTRGIGLKSIMRDSSTVIRIQNGSNTLSTTQTVSTITNNNQLLLRVSSTYSDACISTYWLGASLTNSQVANFRTYYNTFLTNVGLTAFA